MKTTTRARIRHKKHRVPTIKQKKNGNSAEKTTDELREQHQLEDKIATLLLRKGPTHIEELSDSIGLDKQLTFKLLASLKERRPELRIVVAGDTVLLQTGAKKTLQPVDIGVEDSQEKVFRDTITVGLLANLNLGSFGQQMDTIHHVWKRVIPEQKIDTVFINGNFVMSPVLRHGKNESFLAPLKSSHDPSQKEKSNQKEKAKRQSKLSERLELLRKIVEYIAKVWPRQPKGRLVKAHILGSLNEAEWAKSGFDIIGDIVKGRMRILRVASEKSDLLSKGDFFRIFRIRNAGEAVPIVILSSKRVPFRGVYSRSHRPQRTAVTVSAWFLEKLRRAGFEGIPKLVIWTDGQGIFTYRATAAGSHFVSLPSLSVGDPADFDIGTIPNFGMTLIRFYFDEKGHLKENGIRMRYEDLTNYITQRGW